MRVLREQVDEIRDRERDLLAGRIIDRLAKSLK